MILSSQTQEFIKNYPEKFKLRIHKLNQPSWEDYIEQYRCIVNLLIDRKGVTLNSINRPLLFLIRHFLEIHLKNELQKGGQDPIREHSFIAIYKQFEENNLEIPDEIKDAIKILDFDEDGACYRYYQDLEGNIYFKQNTIIQLHKLLDNFQKISTSNLFYKQLVSINQFDNLLISRLTFYMHEISTQAQLRTQYDDVISYIIKLISENIIDINKIYLPFIFLLRHSIELALKDNALKILILENDPNKRQKIEKNIKQEHSLCRLYNIFNRYLSQVSFSNIDEDFKLKIFEAKQKTEDLNRIIHILDNNSRQFRYLPENNRIEIVNDTLSKVLELYIFTDPFVTFVIDVFKENSLIPFSDDELAEIYGY